MLLSLRQGFAELSRYGVQLDCSESGSPVCKERSLGRYICFALDTMNEQLAHGGARLDGYGDLTYIRNL